MPLKSCAGWSKFQLSYPQMSTAVSLTVEGDPQGVVQYDNAFVPGYNVRGLMDELNVRYLREIFYAQSQDLWDAGSEGPMLPIKYGTQSPNLPRLVVQIGSDIEANNVMLRDAPTCTKIGSDIYRVQFDVAEYIAAKNQLARGDYYRDRVETPYFIGEAGLGDGSPTLIGDWAVVTNLFGAQIYLRNAPQTFFMPPTVNWAAGGFHYLTGPTKTIIAYRINATILSVSWQGFVEEALESLNPSGDKYFCIEPPQASGVTMLTGYDQTNDSKPARDGEQGDLLSFTVTVAKPIWTPE